MLISLITTESLRLVKAKTLLLLKRNVFEKEFNFPILQMQAELYWVYICPSQNVEFQVTRRESAWWHNTALCKTCYNLSILTLVMLEYIHRKLRNDTKTMEDSGIRAESFHNIWDKICPSYCFTWHNMSLMSPISLVFNFAGSTLVVKVTLHKMVTFLELRGNWKFSFHRQVRSLNYMQS